MVLVIFIVDDCFLSVGPAQYNLVAEAKVMKLNETGSGMSKRVDKKEQ